MSRKDRMKKLEAEAGVSTSKTYTFHITDREGMCLVEHSFAPGQQPKDHDEQQKLVDMYDKLSLTETWKLLRAKGPRQLTIDDFDEHTYELATNVDEGLITYILDITNRTMPTHHALVLRPFIQRLRDVKMGAYKAPPPPAEGDEDAAETKTVQ